MNPATTRTVKVDRLTLPALREFAAAEVARLTELYEMDRDDPAVRSALVAAQRFRTQVHA